MNLTTRYPRTHGLGFGTSLTFVCLELCKLGLLTFKSWRQTTGFDATAV